MTILMKISSTDSKYYSLFLQPYKDGVLILKLWDDGLHKANKAGISKSTTNICKHSKEFMLQVTESNVETDGISR